MNNIQPLIRKKLFGICNSVRQMSQLQNSMYVAVSLGSRDRNMTTAIPISIQKLKRFDIIHTAL